MLNTLSPIVALWPNSRRRLVTCVSSDTKVGNRPASFLAPTKSRFSSIVDKGKPCEYRAREQREAARQADVAPDQVAVRRIPGQRTSRVGPDHGILDVPVVRVEVIQVANGRRARVRGDDLIRAVELIAAGDLPFAIARLPVRSKPQNLIAAGQRRGIEHRLEPVFPLLVTDADEEIPDPFAIDFEVPVDAAGRVNRRRHDVRHESASGPTGVRPSAAKSVTVRSWS